MPGTDVHASVGTQIPPYAPRPSQECLPQGTWEATGVVVSPVHGGSKGVAPLTPDFWRSRNLFLGLALGGGVKDVTSGAEGCGVRGTTGSGFVRRSRPHPTPPGSPSSRGLSSRPSPRGGSPVRGCPRGLVGSDSTYVGCGL